MIIGFTYVYLYAVNVPVGDTWNSEVSYLQSYYKGDLTIFSFFEQKNDTRPLMSGLLLFVLSLITKYNIIDECYLMLILFSISFSILFLMYKNDFGTSIESLLLFIPVSWYFFNFIMLHNMLQGIRVYQAIAVLGFFASIYLLNSSRNIDMKYFSSVIMAIVSSFSIFAGLLTWPVCAIQIILQRSIDWKKKVVSWIVCSIFIYYIYFHNWAKPYYHPSLLTALSEPLDALNSFFSLIGARVTHLNPTLSLIIGILIILCSVFLFIITYQNSLIEKNAKWYSLLFYTIIVSFATIVGRIGFGTQVALLLNYHLLNFMGIIGLYFIILNHKRFSARLFMPFTSTKNKNSYDINDSLLGIVLCLIFISVFSNMIVGVDYGERSHDQREIMKYQLETYKLQSDEALKNMYEWNPRPKIQFLEEHKLNAFSEFYNINLSSLMFIPSRGYYNIDQIRLDDKVITPSKSPIHVYSNNSIIITGWAIDTFSNTTANNVFLLSKNKTVIPAKYFGNRDDVAKQFNNKNYLKSGFYVSFSTSILNDKNNNLSIAVVSNDKKKVYIKYDVIKIINESFKSNSIGAPSNKLRGITFKNQTTNTTQQSQMILDLLSVFQQ